MNLVSYPAFLRLDAEINEKRSVAKLTPINQGGRHVKLPQTPEDIQRLMEQAKTAASQPAESPSSTEPSMISARF